MTTRTLPQHRLDLDESVNMKLTQYDIAKLITDSVTASLAQAVALGCTPDQVPTIAKAIGGNAGMQIYFEILERGVATED